ncbi:MAG: hypothetical protein ABI687_12060 [Flavitalea sp.]
METLLGLCSIAILMYVGYKLYPEHFQSNPPNRFTEKKMKFGPVLPFLAPLNQEPIPHNLTREYTFEKFIVDKFNLDYFTCIDWKRSKAHKDTLRESTYYPNLEYKYRDKYNSVSFAVECKWQNLFLNDSINWADHHEISTYHQYQNNKRLAIFIVIGVGGSPENPRELFIVPLDKIKPQQVLLTQSFLKPYKKYNIQKNFFLYPDAMELT